MVSTGAEKSPTASSPLNNADFGARKLQPPCDHRAITGMMFLCTLVLYWENVGFSIAFTTIAFEMGLNNVEKGSVFAAYYFGFALTQVPGSYLANRYGGKAIVALSYLLWAPVSALTAIPSERPDYVVPGVIACRMVIGMAQGIMLPAANVVLTHWVPSALRGRDFAFAASGQFLGAAVAMAAVPIIVSDIGATATFHISACMGAVWLSAWACVGSDAPTYPNAADRRKVAQSAGGTFSVTHDSSAWPQDDIDSPAAHCNEVRSMISTNTTTPWALTKITFPQRRNSDIEGGSAVSAAAATKTKSTEFRKGGINRSDDRSSSRSLLLNDATRKSIREKRWNAQQLIVDSTTVRRSERRAPAACAVRHSGDLPVGREEIEGMVNGRVKSRTDVSGVIVQTEATPGIQGKGTPVRTAECRRGKSANGEQRSSSFPWREMTASPAAWACVAGNTGTTVGTVVVMSWLPTYFKELFRINLQDLGFVSLVAPYFTMMTFSVLGGNVYCWLTNTYNISASRSFKLIIGVSFALGFLFLTSMGLATSSTAGTFLSSLALAAMALSRAGWSTYHVEIAAPEHAALLYAFSNTAASTACVAGITLTGKLLETFAAVGQFAWVVALGATGVICGSCATFFLIFAEGDEILFPAGPRNGKYGGLRGRRGHRRGGRGKEDFLFSPL